MPDKQTRHQQSNPTARSSAYRIVFFQLAIAIILSLILLVEGWTTAWSALLGAMVCIIPNLLFAKQLFHKQHQRNSRQVLIAYYRAEVIKLALMVVGLLAILSYLPANLIGLFAGFVAAAISPIFISVILHRQATREVANP